MNRRSFFATLLAAILGRKLKLKPSGPLPGDKIGMSIRYLRNYDAVSDRFVTRMDVLYGCVPPGTTMNISPDMITWDENGVKVWDRPKLVINGRAS